MTQPLYSVCTYHPTSAGGMISVHKTTNKVFKLIQVIRQCYKKCILLLEENEIAEFNDKLVHKQCLFNEQSIAYICSR